MKPAAPIDAHSLRARKARFGNSIGKNGFVLLVCIVGFGVAAAGAVVYRHQYHLAGLLGVPTIIAGLLAAWWRLDLNVVPLGSTSSVNDRVNRDVLKRLKPENPLDPQTVWHSFESHWQAIFISNHLLIHPDNIAECLSTNAADFSAALGAAGALADESGSKSIEVGHIVGGLLATAPAFMNLLQQRKLQPSDLHAVIAWLGRGITELKAEKLSFGGIGRDWAFGFTPLLDRFGENISLTIAKQGAHFGWMTQSPGVFAIETALLTSNGLVLVGPDGVGKTTSMFALAQRFIMGATHKNLAYHQLISLRASHIMSQASQPGQLEYIMTSLANEAAHASHVILFLDDAQLFLGGGPGSFDATQILLPIVQSRSVPLILALSPQDYQRLRAQNPALAGLLTPIVLQELGELDVMRVLEDTAVGLEHRHNVTIGYETLIEAYRLSGRYDQEEAYPGRAVKLLGQALNHAEGSLITAISVQKAIEQTRGVKVATAGGQEAADLLQLEDRIHQRMINQSHAVTVVADALRRARAGVANPKRPIGSFLFLGPTGVGKTELSKAIAATYFGNEKNMIRLDMSEYQQAEDVARLLSNGQTDTSSLIMAVRQQPFSVVLLDEIEKAHPNILNLLLQLLDEGQLTDNTGKTSSFKDCIIIATSNAGANSIRERVMQGQSLESFQEEFTNELITSNQFKPELLNRFDDIVLFRPLNADELAQVVSLMLREINQTIANQNISLALTPAAIALIVQAGNDPRLGARPMRRMLQRAVENVLAKKILSGEAKAGDQVVLDVNDLNLAT